MKLRVSLEVASLLRPEAALRAVIPNPSNVVNKSKVSREVATLLKSVSTPWLRACIPGYANIVFISKVSLEDAFLLRFVTATILIARIPNHANVVFITKVFLHVSVVVRPVFTPLLRAHKSPLGFQPYAVGGSSWSGLRRGRWGGGGGPPV